MLASALLMVFAQPVQVWTDADGQAEAGERLRHAQLEGCR